MIELDARLALGRISPWRRQRAPRGYDLAIFDDSESEIRSDPKYLCTYCEAVLKAPVQSGCGHRFCTDCFNYCVETKWMCSKCQAECEDSACSAILNNLSFPDNAMKRELNSLTIRCCFMDCPWKGCFKDFESCHYKSCNFRNQDSSCPLCQQPLKSTGNDHETMCMDSEAISHFVSCVDKHIRFIENEVIGETFHNPETSAAANRKTIRERIDAVEKLVANISSARDSNRLEHQPAMGLLGGGPRSLPPASDHRVIQSKIPTENGTVLANCLERLPLFEQVMVVLDREVEKLTMDVVSIERQRRLEREAMEKKMMHIERALTLKEVAIAEMRKKIEELEETSYDGTLVWKISDFSRRRQEAISGKVASIYSPPFYTSRTGYKMCARIYLNGDGAGKGSHISLFFVVMRGRHDALLKWPFRQKVTFSLIDQNGRQSASDAFRPDATSSSFRRPTSEMNIASGCPLFMPLSQLDCSSNAYVKDDTAFVKIAVDRDDPQRVN